jgi:hypothetical protein
LLETETAALPLLKPEHAADIAPLPAFPVKLVAVKVTDEPVVGLNVPSAAGLTDHWGAALTTAPYEFLQTAV